MSQNNDSTAKQNIALVKGDRARRYGQLVIIFVLIAFTIGFVSWYSMEKADDNFLLYIAVGLVAILFAGIGASFSNMGLGRTVGSSANNNSADPATIEAVITALLARNGITFRPPNPLAEIPDIEDEFFEDNQDDDLETDQPKEVPIERPGTGSIAAINADPGLLSYLADKNTWHNELKTINGKPVVLVATQISRRGKRKRTVYVYHVIGTNLIIYNRSRHGIFFMRIAFRSQNMQAFYDTFVSPPQTAEENTWLERNDYVLV